jgi:hypothetical protein
MSCTLATLKLCLSLSGIYVDSGLEYHDVGEWRSQPYTQTVLAQSYSEGGQTDSHPVQFTTYRSINSPQNPYARIGAGYQADIEIGRSRLILSAGWWHDSSIASGSDRGVNAYAIGAKYFPFARAD